MKAIILGIAAVALCTACEQRIEAPPSAGGGETKVEKNTTVVNPPAEKKESNTTIVNPPAEKKTESNTTVVAPSGGGASSTTSKTTTTTSQ